MSDVRLQINNRCFGCGSDNPIGLKMRIEREGDEWVSRMTVPENFEGWSNMAHGGFLCTVMDEVMAWAMRGADYRSVTARLNARFNKPVPVGSRITARGRLVTRRGKLVKTRAQVELADGTIAAEAEGSFIIIAEGAAA
ncbi:MAG: PaaI family thioesterase [Armatimonadota bacterium]|nr:MAG: PaaI family thioesterase [Armatimonadota bacterium]